MMMLRSDADLIAASVRNIGLLRLVTTARKYNRHSRNICYDVPLREDTLVLPYGRNVTVLSLGVTMLRFLESR